MGCPFWLCPGSSIRLWATYAAATELLSRAWLAKPSRHVKSASTGGEKQSLFGGGVGDCIGVSGSKWILRFLKGREHGELSVLRLWEAPRPKLTSVPWTAWLWFSKRSVPAHARGAAATMRPLQSSVPRSRIVVRRSSGAVAADWWSPVMILSINGDQGPMQ